MIPFLGFPFVQSVLLIPIVKTIPSVIFKLVFVKDVQLIAHLEKSVLNHLVSNVMLIQTVQWVKFVSLVHVSSHLLVLLEVALISLITLSFVRMVANHVTAPLIQISVI